jgi:gamma-glutamyl:cysteine ligase YbdK (ATP-grasp superfamily)
MTIQQKEPLSLFEGYGVELEYMIVDRDSLSVRAIADRLLQDAAEGEIVSDIDHEKIAWSNELALHVVELKTNGPAPSLSGLADEFHREVKEIESLLAKHNARLMPAAMHPWMDPHTEFELWPHEYGSVYAAYDRIFDCHGHGWANLQSMHINLPFADDEEFGRLHAAIRLVLPLLPALAASSPIVEGKKTEWLDTRLEVYRTNARRIPSLIGRVIPEPVYTERDYDEQIFQPMFRDIAPNDPEGLLQDEFLNSRGAIARFSRNAIEIRLIDVQECPKADLAICALVVEVLKLLTSETWQPLEAQQAFETAPLEAVFLSAIRDAQHTAITNAEYLACFGLKPTGHCTLGDVWRHLSYVCQKSPSFGNEHAEALGIILTQGTLSDRILKATAGDFSRPKLLAVYRELCECLSANRVFSVGD